MKNFAKIMKFNNTVTVLSFMFALAMSSMVNLTSEWNPNFGWNVTCSWKLLANDSLQSVRLYKNDQQFLVYRPEVDGSTRSALSRLPNIELRVDCTKTDPKGITGRCVMLLEILQPVLEDMNSTCEVSGERPTFRVQSKTVQTEAFVPPSNAVVEKLTENEEYPMLVNLNCSSTGMPAPSLAWTIGDQKIHQDFSGKKWNFTSKLFDVWSSLTYTLENGNSHAVCTPEITKEGKVVKGQPAYYNAASERGTTTVIMSFLTILNLIR